MATNKKRKKKAEVMAEDGSMTLTGHLKELRNRLIICAVVFVVGVVVSLAYADRLIDLLSAMGDMLGGMNLTIGILMALHARQLTGRGQRVDVALVDSVVASLETGTQRYFASGKLPELMGNRYAAAYPYDSFAATDGSFVIACGNDHLFLFLQGHIPHDKFHHFLVR